MQRAKAFFRRLAVLAVACSLAGVTMVLVPGCSKPNLYGPGRFHDISRVKIGMTHTEVQNIMGTDYKSIWEEGLGGMDMGIYIWQYHEGRVHFNTSGVIKVQPY